MSDLDKNKSVRGKKRRMYQTVEEEVSVEKAPPIVQAKVVKEDVKQKIAHKDTSKNEAQIEAAKSELSKPEVVKVEATKVESSEEIKFKGRLISKAKQEELNTLVRKNIYWSMGLSVLPFPIIDSFLVSTIQLKMLDEISRIYEVPFRENAGKAYLASLVGSTSHQVGTQIIKSFIKKIPVIGFASAFVSPVLAAATTYAIAKVFIYHYELGGTLLDFKPEKVRVYFAKQLKDGKSKIHNLNAEYNFTNA